MTYEFETCRLSGEGNTIFPDEIIIDDEEAVVIHRKPKLIGCRETKMHIDYLPPKSRPAAYGSGDYWSSTLCDNNNTAWDLDFDWGGFYLDDSSMNLRWHGKAIRACTK
ncbi:MAG: hypothetical protein MJZ69_06810 [Bacteroidaceae bacterium]|nr:hypothetical protein [Bacteroidaceae bacterium]